MASGLAHYRQAEELLAKAAGLDPSSDGCSFLVFTAQAHATLALAAATALNDGESGMTLAEMSAWQDGASAHVDGAA